MEEYLGSIMGEEPSYVRPMDASESKIGPLVSMAEDAVVEWDTTDATLT